MVLPSVVVRVCLYGVVDQCCCVFFVCVVLLLNGVDWCCCVVFVARCC